MATITFPVTDLTADGQTAIQSWPKNTRQAIFTLNAPTSGVTYPWTAQTADLDLDASYDGGVTWRLLVGSHYDSAPIADNESFGFRLNSGDPAPDHWRFRWVISAPISLGGTVVTSS